jgi:hypothetical protein
MAKKLKEGESKTTDLPMEHVMVERMEFGLHSIAIFWKGIQKAKVWVRDYPHWESAFDAAMDKAGI